MKRAVFHMEYLPLALLAAVFWIAFYVVPGFNQSWMIPVVTQNASYHGIIALGLLPVLISGNIDLSVGAQMSFYGVLCAVCIKNGWPIWLAVSVTLLSALLIGCIQGAVIAGWHLNSILVSISMSMFLIGVSNGLNRRSVILNLPSRIVSLGRFETLGLSLPTLVWIAAALFMALVLRQTYWGRFFYAVGFNALVAERTGVPILPTKMVAFGLDSLFCALSSLVYISQLGFAPLSNGQDATYSVLTIAALSGVSFSGGRGKVSLVVLGGLMAGALPPLFTLAGVPTYFQNCIKSLILFVAISTNFLKS